MDERVQLERLLKGLTLASDDELARQAFEECIHRIVDLWARANEIDLAADFWRCHYRPEGNRRTFCAAALSSIGEHVHVTYEYDGVYRVKSVEFETEEEDCCEEVEEC